MATAADHMVMNSVIHSGLRRDLGRLSAVLASPMSDPQRQAVCEFVPWLTKYLHHHHVGEDKGMWPRVLAKRPDLAELAHGNAAEHQEIVVASARLEAASAMFAAERNDANRRAMSEAVESMTTATIPHLDHEEAESVPVVVGVLDAEDWSYLEKNYYRKGLPMRDVGIGLMWMLDDLDAQRLAVVKRQIPGPVLGVMGLIFGRSYDRAAAQRWGQLAGRRS